MSKLMQVLGIVLLAAGIALAIMGLVNQAQLQVRGIEMASAINLIIGGILAIGLGGVISAVGGHAPRMDYAIEDTAPEPVAEAAPARAVEEAVTEDKPAEEAPARKPMRFPSFGRKLEEAGVATAATATAATAAVAETAAKAEEVVTPAVKETIDALEQAKSDLENALTGNDSVENMETAEAAEPADGELFVVEDKVVRGRPARILSDGTVEAETEEGWMRFENLEHLDEYLDAVEQA
jgi:hypothetical protein